MINQHLLRELISARRTGTLIDALPDEARPATLDDAYAIADALAESFGRAVVGWKIGASIPRAWERMGLTEPFGGRIFEGTVYPQPATLTRIPGTLTIGAEFAFRLARDLRVDEGDFSAATIAEVIDAVYPALELNRPDFTKPMEMGGLCLIADNGVNVGLVLGSPIADWRIMDLAGHSVSFAVNEIVKSSGAAADIGFDPIAAVAWLANDRARRGDLILNVEASTGDRVAADFGDFGTVELLM